MLFQRKDKQISINVQLKCSDGLYKSLGFCLPKEIDSFIKFINEFSELKEYIEL